MSGRKWITGRKKRNSNTAANRAAAAVKRAIVVSNRKRTPMYVSPRNVEKKYWDIVIGPTVGIYCSNPVANLLPTPPVGMIPINVVPLGNGPTGRIGRNITITSIFYRTVISLETTATSGHSQMTRTVVILDKQANGTTPTAVNMYYETTTGNIQPYSPMNLENSSRFKVLSDENRILLANGAISAAPTATSNVCWIENYIRTNIRVTFNNSATGDQRDIATNCLYYMTIGEFTSAQIYNATSNAIIRIRYTDD